MFGHSVQIATLPEPCPVVWPLLADFAAGVAGAWLILAASTLLGLLLATLVRNAGVAIGLAFVWLITVEGFLGQAAAQSKLIASIRAGSGCRLAQRWMRRRPSGNRWCRPRSSGQYSEFLRTRVAHGSCAHRLAQRGVPYANIAYAVGRHNASHAPVTVSA
jgi:hypothetical protein